MKYKHKVGQHVYLSKDLHGWSNYAVYDLIPVNTFGTIMSCGSSVIGGHLPLYKVKLEGKLGEQFILETYLKLG
jgi:hypothetical protein